MTLSHPQPLPLPVLLERAIAHHQAGQLAEAEQTYRKILQTHPKHTQANFNLGVLALQLQKPALAQPFFLSALENDPGQEQCWQACIEVSLQLGELDSARRLWLEARDALGDREALLALEPRLSSDALAQAESLYQRGQQLRQQGYLLEAELCWRQAMRLQPRLMPEWQDLCASLTRLNEAIALTETGELAKARLQLQDILRHEHSWLGHSALLFGMLHDTDVSVEDMFSAHRGFGERAEQYWPLNATVHANPADPERPLRVGFVSGDLRNHPVAAFLEPALRHLQGRPFQLYAYSNYPKEDEVSSRLRSYLHQWRNIYPLDDETAAQLIRNDGIDILIDLSGHTAYNRLPLFARKPAPLQASWIGYPGTTGLRAMDYYFLIGDQPRFGSLREQFTEKLISLPTVVPFQPLTDAPPVNPLPAFSNGHMTFASFNRISKVNDTSLALWGHVLTALPGARLLLGGLDPSATEEALIRCLEQGMDRQQLILCPRMNLQDYLRLHHRVDLLLDTYPYSGGTTTLYGLWMGVPTLTLAGPTLASRQGVANLSSVGLDDFVAVSQEAYVSQAVAWASRLEELARIRAGLRSRLMDSGPGDGDGAGAILAKGLESAWRTIWRRWCRGEPTDSLKL